MTASLRRRTQVLLLPFLVLLSANLALDRYLVSQRDELIGVVHRHLDPARVAVAELLAGLIDQETGERGYIITGQEAFLDPYRSGGERVDARLDDLDRLLDFAPDLAAGVQRLRSRVTAWRQLGAEFELEAKRAGRDADAVALVATRTSMVLFDGARGELADLQAALRAEHEAANDRIEELRGRLTVVHVAGFALGAGIVALAGTLLSRWITRPVKTLERAVRIVAAGALDQPIPSVGPAELSGLGRDVEAMRRRLLEEVNEATVARAALAKRGMVVLALRDELAPSRLDVHDGLDIAARFQPADGVVAGDWFDVVHLGGTRYAIVLVDVSGHGAEAGIFALRTKYLTLAALNSGLGPAEALAALARQLGDTGDHFLTGVVLEVDASSGRVRYASAGHPPVLLAAGRSVVALGPTGPLLGPLDASWADAEATVAPGAGALALFSDGLIESRGDDGTEFGIEGLTALLQGMPAGSSPECLAEACLDELARRGGPQRQDDITLVVVGCVSAADDGGDGAEEVGGELQAELVGHAGVER